MTGYAQQRCRGLLLWLLRMAPQHGLMWWHWGACMGGKRGGASRASAATSGKVCREKDRHERTMLARAQMGFAFRTENGQRDLAMRLILKPVACSSTAHCSMVRSAPSRLTCMASA